MKNGLGLSVAAAAEELGISENHCRKLVRTGRIPAVRWGGRIIIPRRALEDSLDREALGPYAGSAL